MISTRGWMAAAALTAFGTALLPGATFAAELAVLATYPVPGEGGWDYLTYDAAGHRLFISRGDRVQVVDTSDGHLIAEIPDTPGVHGIALAPGLDKGYISNGRDNSLTVFALGTLKAIGKIPTPQGLNPDFIVYDPATRRVVAFNGRSRNASIVDATTDTLVTTLALPGKPEAAAVDAGGMIHVAIEDRNELATLDLHRQVVSSSWALPGCVEPAALALDAAARRLFVGCHNRSLLVLDAERGQVLAQLPIGEGVDAAAFDPGRQLAFSSQGDGSLTVVREISAQSFAVDQTVTTLRSARTMALNAEEHLVYLVGADFEQPSPGDAASRPRRVMRAGSFRLVVVGVSR